MGPSTCAETITRVTLGSIDNASTGPLNTGGTECYSDYLSVVTNLPIDSTSPITVHIAGGDPATSVIAWVDWNHDYVLSNLTSAGERYILTTADNGLTYAGTISVPASALSGQTRLRIFATPSANATSCSFGPSGEVEDYTVQITQAIGACCSESGVCTTTTAAGCTAPSVFTEESCGPLPDCCARAVNCTNSESISTVVITGVGLVAAPPGPRPPGCYSGSNGGGSGSMVVCPGVDYEMSVHVSNDGGATEVHAWIDWNQDGLFMDAGEHLTLLSQDSGTFHFALRVPEPHLWGASTMRIRVGPGLQSPCGITAVGETWDLTLQVGLPMGICCTESGCCFTTCSPDSGDPRRTTPENCQSPDKYLPCAATCEPNTCPKPPTLYAVLAGGVFGTLFSDPEFNTDFIKSTLDDFARVDRDKLELADTRSTVDTAMTNILRDIQPGDTLLFYMIGHGGFCEPNEPGCNGRTSLPGIALQPPEAAAFPNSTHNTGMSYVFLGGGGANGGKFFADDLAQLLSHPDLAEVNKVIIIDACFSGGFSRPPGVWASVTRKAFAFSSAAHRFSVALGDPMASDHHGALTVAFKNALDQQNHSLGIPPLDDIVNAISGHYHCTTNPCDLAIGAPTADQIITVANPDFSLVYERSPDFDGSKPLSSAVPWCGPALSSHPSDARACPGQPSTFTVTHADTSYTHQWRLAGVPLTDQPGHIAGVSTATLTITNATNADAGNYDCIVGNSCGTLTSAAAALTVCPPDVNCTGTLSVQDIFDFLALYFAGDPIGDFNHSGTISVQDIFDFLASYFAGCP